jgi:hypothetical protein
VVAGQPSFSGCHYNVAVTSERSDVGFSAEFGGLERQEEVTVRALAKVGEALMLPPTSLRATAV